jgi:hypothetical protein
MNTHLTAGKLIKKGKTGVINKGFFRDKIYYATNINMGGNTINTKFGLGYFV